MSISQTTPEETSSGYLSCPRCDVVVPSHATFCSSCGERLNKQATPIDKEDIQTRYRITTLVRRYPSSNLYFALDNQCAQGSTQTRMVAMRDIDITGLSEAAQEEAIALAQEEYDQLRQWHIPHTLACIDLRIFQGHLFLISGAPIAGNEQRLYTLQDFLQSGLGLPREKRALEWMRHLCQSVEQVHHHGIVLADLDPYTVVLDKNSAQAEPNLMIFWLPPRLQQIVAQPARPPAPHVSYFKAPEALKGKAEVRSDVYSLGALLYLLTTGTPPDESTLRHRRRLRSPREVNTRISQHVDECVMQALALEPEERFASVGDLLAALADKNFKSAPRKPFASAASHSDIALSDAETVRIVPLSQKDVARWRAMRQEQAKQSAHSSQPLPTLSALPPAATPPSSDNPAQQEPEGFTPLPTTPPPDDPALSSSWESVAHKSNTPPPAHTAKASWAQYITHILPAAQAEPAEQKKRKKFTDKTKKGRAKKWSAQQLKNEGDLSLLKQIQRLLLGQQHPVEAAAIIETPMRIRPDQPYNLRLHIMGRDEPTPHPDAKKGATPAGLSALIHGEIVQIEVRSVLQQGYTYILQHATVTIPAAGYAADVTIPMQQQPLSATSRRDRLHIFLLDEHRHPLYEKPFVVEIFVSPLVQFGREGHQVLTIPI